MKLSNGLKVLLIESHKSPVVSVQAWVKTGSADEPESLAGISHFIEHLVFKGTHKYGTGEIASSVEGAGGELNAYTTFDQTVFYVTISKEFAELALDVVSEMMGFPLFDAKEVDNEREVVIEEIKRGEDSPRQRASKLLFENVFTRHTYARPIIGYSDVIRRVPVKNIQKYFNENYVPKNMFLVVAGNFDPKQMKKWIKEYFGRLLNRPVRKRKRPPTHKSSAGLQRRIKIQKADFQQSFVYLSWKTPSIRHRDIPALDVLSMILGQGDSSRLVRRLRIQKARVSSIGSFTYALQDGGMFAISAAYDKANFAEILSEIREELKLIMSGELKEEELTKAIINFVASEIHSIETVDNISRKAGSYELFMGDHEYYKKYLDQVKATTVQDLKRVVHKYLVPDQFTASILTNEDGDKTKKLVNVFVKALFQKVTPKKASKPAEKKKKDLLHEKTLKQIKSIKIKSKSTRITKHFAPPLHQYSLNNGGRLLIRQQKEIPSVSVKLAFHGGIRIEDSESPGSAELFSKSWVGETEAFSEQKLHHDLDLYSASIQAFSGKNSSGLELEYLSAFEKPLQEILTEVLLHPKFSDQILDRERQIQSQQIKARMDNSAQLAMLEFAKVFFKGHPYERDPLGTLDSLMGIKRAHLEDLYRKLVVANGFHLCVVGDVNLDQWLEYAEKLNSGMPKRKQITHQFELPQIREEVTLFREAKKEQTHIVCAYPGLAVNNPNRYTLDILQAVLSGQGGRLFFELRDKMSLAYTVSPLRMAGIEGGYFGGYIACSPDKTQTAIDKMKSEFMRIAENKITEQELKRAQRYLIGSHDIDLQRKSHVSQMILFDDIYGNNPLESLNVADHYYDVTAERVQAIAQQIFCHPAVVSIVGPSK